MQPHIGKRGKRKEGDFGHLNYAFLVLENKDVKNRTEVFIIYI